MLKIQPIQDKSLQKALCALCSVEYKEEFFCYVGYDGEDITAICQFYLNGEYGIIDEIAYATNTDNIEMIILIGRSALSFIDFCGVHKAVYSGKNIEFAKLLGFKADENGILKADLTTHHCCGGK